MPSIRLDDRSPATNADGLILVEGVDGYWEKATGVKHRTTRPMYSDGLTNIKRKAGSGSTEWENVTLERAFDPVKDASVLAWIEQQRCAVNGFAMTVRVVERCNGTITPRGNGAWRLQGCRVERFEGPDIDTGSGEEVQRLKVELSVEQAAWE